jgi:xylulokinase
MASDFLLGLDIGTFSSKGVLVDAATGESVANYEIEHALSIPKPGWVEHDPEKIWWNELVEICHYLLTLGSVNPLDIKGMGISGLGACILPIDADGNPLRPAILYGIDTRASEEIKDLENRFGKERIFKTSGSQLCAQSAGPKILWIKNHEPDVFLKTHYFLTSQAYLVYKLTGQVSLDHYTSADFAPMIDIRYGCWEPEITEYITPRERLPELTWSCQIAGLMTGKAAKETGLLPDIPVIVGTTDSGAEAVSAGVSLPGDLLIMFGSSIFFILRTKELNLVEHFWSAPWLESDEFVIQGGISTAGSLTRWFRDNLAPQETAIKKSGGENVYETLAKMLLQSPIGANGLIALPYFAGERTPINDPQASGLLFGLSLDNTRADIYRALLESVGFAISHNIDIMKKEGVVPKRIVAVSGGIRNKEWMKIVCDIANIEMLIPQQQIGASYGDAYMAGVGVGLFKNLGEIDKWVQSKDQIYPNYENTQKYMPYYKIYRELYNSTAPQMHELSRLVRG